MERNWWNDAVVYQVYWRSFYDTSGDGYGDLQGVIAKLDYLGKLGVDIIWLNPVYESPDKDNGYDIADYQAVMEKAGTMEDLEELISEVHKHGMRVIMDLVVNHTSNQHPWFQEAQASKDNPKRDWYIWKNPHPKTGGAPNNWRSYFTPSAWEYDQKTEQYYMHSFAIEQPDLNWENPELRHAIYEMMRFWLNKGIDGFRLDVINLLAKQKGFPDAEHPESLDYLGNNPGIHDYLQEMNQEVLQGRDLFTVGEIPFVKPEDGVLYVGENRNELHTLFHFEVADDMPHWDMVRFKQIQQRWYDELKGRGWVSQFLNNHDHTRQVTRYGNDSTYRVESAKLLATLIPTLPGIPYIYQGEEIGMTGVRFDSIEDYDDIATVEKYKQLRNEGYSDDEALDAVAFLSRDNSRTPMHWHAGYNGGFTTGKPWLAINPNHQEINVQQALDDPNSIFYYYQKLINLRKQHDVLVYGDYKDYTEGDEYLYAFSRTYKDETWLVVLNHNDEESPFTKPDVFKEQQASLILSNYEQEEQGDQATWSLRPHEARIYRVNG